MKSYDEIYKENPEHPWTFDDWEETKLIVDALDSWEGKRVLDIGCGTGDLAALLTQRFAIVSAIDPSVEAIQLASEKYGSGRFQELVFAVSDYRSLQYKKVHADCADCDVITMKGVLEHVEEDPFVELKWIMDNLLKPDGTIIITCPNWENMRGSILQTMAHLDNAQITRMDRHYISSTEVNNWAIDNNLHCSTTFSESSWGWGKKMMIDLGNRLPKICDNEMGIKRLLAYLRPIAESWEILRLKMLGNLKISEGWFDQIFPGAVACYKLWREND